MASGWHCRETNSEFPSARTILGYNLEKMCWKKHLLRQREALPAQAGERSWAEAPHLHRAGHLVKKRSNVHLLLLGRSSVQPAGLGALSEAGTKDRQKK